MDVLIPKKKWWFVARWWWVGILVLAATGAAGIYWPRPGQRLHVAASRLTISPVIRGNFQEFTAIDGVVQPLRTVYLDAAEAGTVQQVLVEEGATLTAGQPLLQLANPDLQLEMVNRETAVYELMNNLRNTRNQLLQNRILRQNQLAEIDFQLAEARRVFDSNQQLYDQQVIARQDYLQSQNAYHYQRRRRQLTQQTLRQDSVAMLQQLGTMQESVRRMSSNLALMRRKLDDLLLRAPVGGRLSSLAAEVGEAKTRGQRLGQIDALVGVKLHATVDEFYIARIETGQVGEVIIEGQAYALRVTKVFAQVAKGLQIDLAFTGAPPPSLRRGQTLPIRLALSAKAPAVLLPKGGFYQQTVGNWAFKLGADGTRAQRVAIRLGRQNPDYYEVLAGLRPGDRVVTSSYEGYADHQELVLDGTNHNQSVNN
ncbi:HlyD family efflux transporter periplasmic adaptor subunit [Hymenobacter lapidiphilus]|uniref:efflux RND transporter periplasmic adaptor subunit n=1 Tax=Hymenobacter sp. CCM 8763 TaxID=2303334 RepID=UPI000E350DF7|nr:HlyD family efflux transporter periplasmic adaptor subunit [Hymenobacter sp. CCM 8763]RFP64396.1 HlyD family efflux transporter periplasmic adaptor subunit [Hymenobacter sp. CCM 8763]